MSYSRQTAAITLCLACLYGFPASADEEALDAYYTGDYQTAIEIWKPQAEAGDAEAQFYLGAMIGAGQGVDKDLTESARWFEKAAKQGNVEAQYNLGVAYKDGQGVAQDNARAVKWWREAAEAGYARAQYNLASMYYYGQGVSKDTNLARSWYSKAAEQGDQAAARILTKLGSVQPRSNEPAGDDLAHAGRKTAVIPLDGHPADLSKPDESSANTPEDNSGEIQSDDWVLAQDAANYTVQLYASASKAAILDFISSHPVPDTVAYYQYQSGDKSLYRVVTGSYISYLDAGEAVRRLSPQLKEWSPWIRKLEGIQKEIKSSRREPAVKPTVNVAKPEQAPPLPAVEKVTRTEETQALSAKPDVKQKPTTANPEHFTIQVCSAENEKSVRSFLTEAGLQDNITIYRVSRNGAPWYRAIYGDFPDRQVASKAVEQLPPAVQATKPWIRKVASINKEQIEVVKASSASETPKKETTESKVAKPAAPPVQAEPAKPLNQPKPAPQPALPVPAKIEKTMPPKTPPKTPMVAKANPRHTPVASRRASPNQVKKILRAGQTSFMIGDYVSAYRMWRPLAEDGVKEAQYNLGFMYESGWGVTQNFAEAISWYRSAAEQGEFRAQFNLGLLYLSGHGVDKNADQGIYWVERAAAKGHLRAQEFLANAYESGEYGLRIDPKKSRFWANKAGLE